MKLEMTEKDKKLLVMLSIFVIVVCIGYWGVYPALKAINSTDKQIEEEEAIKQENEAKLAELPMLEADKEAWEEDIRSVRETFFPMMDSSEIDKYFTSMVLGYNLEAYDLSIQIADEETSLEPYQYSERAEELAIAEEAGETDEAESGSSAEMSQIEEAEEEGGMSSDDETSGLYTDEITTGIYSADVTMRLGGDEADLLRLIEDLSASDMKIKICSYSWAEQKSVASVSEEGSEDEEYEVVSERVLTITLQVYMYQEDLNESDTTEEDVSGEE